MRDDSGGDEDKGALDDEDLDSDVNRNGDARVFQCNRAAQPRQHAAPIL
jgi:hypothetical protein